MLTQIIYSVSLCLCLLFQDYNPALRLKPEANENNLIGSGSGTGASAVGSGAGSGASALGLSGGSAPEQDPALTGGQFSTTSALGPRIDPKVAQAEIDSGVNWKYFNEREYIDAGGLKPGEDAYKRNKFNQAASDKLPSNRYVPDTRGSGCRAKDYSAAAADAANPLPPTSIIITFHNEARSTLLRTIVR